MRNVRVISFVDRVIEAGFQRIKPREEITIQYDLLFPYVMHYHKDDIAIASIERVAEHVGKNADMAILKSNFWIFPKEEEKAKGAPTVKPAAEAKPEKNFIEAFDNPMVLEAADEILGEKVVPTEVKVEGDSVSMRPVAPSDFNMPTPTVAISGKTIEDPVQERRKKGRR